KGASGGAGGAAGKGSFMDGGGIITTGGAGGGDGGSGNGGTGFDPDAKICGGIEVAVEVIPLSTLILFDQSSSMTEFLDGMGPPTRWEAMTNALIEYFKTPEAQSIGIGLAYFGQFDTRPDAGELGGTSCHVEDYTTPEVEIAPVGDPGQMQKLIDSIGKHGPVALTPTGPALQGAHTYAKAYAMSHLGRKTMVMLATDGIATLCAPQQSYDIASAIAGPALNGMPSIRTLVVAAANGLSALGAISMAGGTGQPVVVTDPTTTSSLIKTQFQQLSRTNFACSYRIPAGGEGGRTDPGLVNVHIRTGGGMDKILPLYSSSTRCATGDGWYYDNPARPENILLCPATCANLFNGELRIVVGCAAPPPM
ncbi:MAG TPA: VWA domain-containing protein, partial [Polyangiaceae bacterium]|nr:VWA domain-containing protein [Polyangiaceae bacterium]